MQLVPYIFFYGRCEEALEFYKTVFGGSYEAMRVSDSPMKDQMPPGSEKLIMHASFTAEPIRFMAADGRDIKPIDPDAGNISLAIAADDRATGARLHKALADGGKVAMPFEDAFWGGQFGMVVDRFGNEWMITAP
jgi:PhnB protein